MDLWWHLSLSVVGLLCAIGIDRRAAALRRAAIESERLERRVSAIVALMDERARDFAEAIELANYGARDEAAQLLRKWSVPADGGH